MSRIIYKYPLEIKDGAQTIEFPSAVHLVSVQVQHGQIVMWGVVEDDPPEGKDKAFVGEFFVIGTGQPFPTEKVLTHLGTVQLNGFVWHIFGGEV